MLIISSKMEKERTLFVLCTLTIFFSLGCSITAALPEGKDASPNTSKPVSPLPSSVTTNNIASLSASNKTTTSTSQAPTTTTPSPTTSTAPNTTTSTPSPTTSTPSPTTSTPSPTTSTPSPTTSTPSPTTPSPITSSVPPVPSSTPAPKPDRSFDLPSFVGGIILALGILAIGYVVYKFYRARTDPNYRTL